MGLIRLVMIGVVLLIIYFLLKRLFVPSDFKKCGKCDGKGYWVALRGRETCDVCRGAGRVPKQ